MPAWLVKLLKSRKIAKLAADALLLLAGNRSTNFHALYANNKDRAFEAAVRAAAKAAGVEVDATELRLTIARIELARQHDRLERLNAELDEIIAKSRR
jgi:DNA-binding sugar fermentation-stimulating protein